MRRFSSTVSEENSRRPSGTMVTPRATIFGRPNAADRLAVEADHVGRGADHADDGFQERAFAGAVGADHRHRLACIDRHRNAVKRLEIAVESGQRIYFQKRHRRIRTLSRAHAAGQVAIRRPGMPI